MAKILLLLIVIAVVYSILKKYSRHPDSFRRGATPRGEDMVRCAQCGVHLPRSESLMSDQTFYCSAEHRSAHQHSTL